jgi:hypothetical protein
MKPRGASSTLRWSLVAMPFFLVFLLLTAVLPGAELARWTAGQPALEQGIRLVEGPDASWRMKRVGGVPVASVTPVPDYYRRASFLVRVERPASANLWLTIGYLDRGFGVVSITHGANGSKGVGARDQWGVARLNTDRVRHAAFRLDKPEFHHQIDPKLNPGADIRIQGVPWLHSLSISDHEPEREPTPEVKPAVTLNRPMDLVTTAGADASTVEGLTDSLASMRNLIPLVKALGFNGVESYVKWNFVERERGKFDWSFYDTVVAELEKNGLRWFPLLIAGSAYALPDWYFDSEEMEGYRCLEHGITTDIPTIFNDNQVKYVRRFLNEFGKHYASRTVLLGVRLGPSANYGEAQYPATGAWGYRNRGLHTHLGYWAGDPGASRSFQQWLHGRYPDIATLNRGWETEHRSFDDVKTFLPGTAYTPRMRLDFANWYMWAMADWCEKWAAWAREAMPRTPIYQSSGGWGAVEIGTDYTAHTKSMAKLKGGIRLTNENDSYLNNVGATRLAASAARFYGARLGFEPAGFSSVRGVVGRIYNSLTNDADHLFYYHGNLIGNDEAAEAWVAHAPLLDQRAQPASEIAVFYPDSANRLSDDVLRHLRASAFFRGVQAFRDVSDFDFASEEMIVDGALDRYKVLVFLWGRVAERPVLDALDRWVAAGGTVIYPERQQAREGGLATPEGDFTLWNKWKAGETGKGQVIFFDGHPEPVHYYMNFLRDRLPRLDVLSPAVRAALRMEKPVDLFWSVLANGKLALLNYGDEEAVVRTAQGKTIRMRPYTIALEDR